jgi:hypothetical protein
MEGIRFRFIPGKQRARRRNIGLAMVEPVGIEPTTSSLQS